MSHVLKILPSAEADLAELFDFVSMQSGRRRAIEYIQQLQDVCFTLERFPDRGKPRDDLAPGIRSLSVNRRAIVAYRVLGKTVEIVHVFYAGRNFGADDFLQ